MAMEFFRLKIAKGDILSWTHADLQTDPRDIISALNEFKKHNDPLLVIKGKDEIEMFWMLFTWDASYCALKLNSRLNDINAQPKLFESFMKKL